MLSYQVLGHLRVLAEGKPVSLTRPLERRLLAALLVSANRAVSVDRLIEALWPGEQPTAPARALQTAVYRLRSILGSPGSDSVIRRVPNGYQLDVARGAFDALEFERAVTTALAASAGDADVPTLRKALDLWYGEAYEDFKYDDFFAAEAARLEELRALALERMLGAAVAAGEYDRAISDAELLLESFPLRENLYATLVRALYLSGRQADALRVFRRAERVLGEEVGLEPGPELRRLEQQVLVHDPMLRGDEAQPGTAEVMETKIQVPPLRPGLIVRSTLLDRLTAGGSVTLTVVRGPAGSGKTTLLAQWAELGAERVAWVTLDRSENDPVLFWRYVLASLRRVAPGLAEDPWAVLQGPGPNLAGLVIPGIVNALVKETARVMLVLDDYHVIDNEAVHGLVRLFVNHLPRAAEIVVGTRVAPPLQTASLRSRQLFRVVTARDLAFTEQETAQVMAQFGPGYSAAEVARIHEKTEGWAAGVFMAGFEAVHAEQLSGRTQAIREYLVGEVLDHLAPDERAFFVRTAMLDRLSGELCDSVTGDVGSAGRLRDAAAANLLLAPLDAAGEWFRIHPLLREALLSELDDLPETEVSRLHMRAHEWFANHEYWTEAIRHAADAGEKTIAADLICRHWYRYLMNGRLSTARQWLQHFTSDEIEGYPPLAVAAAALTAFSGEVTRTRRFAAVARLATFDGPVPSGAASFESSVALLQATLCHDGAIDALENAERAYRLEPVNSPWHVLATVNMAVARAVLDAGPEAERLLLKANSIVPGNDVLTVFVLGHLAMRYAWQGDWEQADRYCRDGIALVEDLHAEALPSSGFAYAAAALVRAHSGDHDGAHLYIAALSRMAHALSEAMPFPAFYVHTVLAEAHLALGELSAAEANSGRASYYLEILGDGGVVAERLRDVIASLDELGDVAEDVSDPKQEPLTPREQQILWLLDSKLTLRQIAYELHISTNTAKGHVNHIYRKLGVSNRRQAVARGRELQGHLGSPGETDPW